MRQRTWLGLVVLISLCLAAPPILGSALLAVAAALWLLLDRRPGRRFWVAGVLVLAGLLLLAESRLSSPPGSTAWQEIAQKSVDSKFRELRDLARKASTEFGSPPDPTSPIESFGFLERLASESPELSWYLIDPDSEALAWAGPGLLHEIEGRALIPGADRLSSYTATSLLYSQPLGETVRPWSLVVGRTYLRRNPPLPAALLRGVDIEDWSLRRADTESGYLFVLKSAEFKGPWRGTWWRAAAVLLGVLLLSLVIERGSNRSGVLERRELGLQIVTGVLGLEAVLAAIEIDFGAIAALGVGGLFALTLSQLPLAGTQGRWGRSALRSSLGIASLVTLAAGYVVLVGPRPLGDSLSFEVHDIALRTGLLAAFVSILWSGAAAPTARPRLLPVTLSFAILMISTLVPTQPALAFPLLLVATALGAIWLGVRSRSDGGPILAMLVFAAIGSGVVWEIALHFAPSNETAATTEIVSVEERRLLLAEFFEGQVAREILERPVDAGESRDLAVALWRASPLSDRTGLSAVAVSGPSRGTSTFSWGLPLTGSEFDPEVLEDSGVFSESGVMEWLEEEITVELDMATMSLRYWWLPIEGSARFDSKGPVELDLLRGGAVRGFAGRLGVATQDATLVRPGSRPSAAFLARSGPTGIEIRQGDDPPDRTAHWAGLERVGTHALMALLPCVLVGLAVLILNLSGRPFRERARRWLRSYSRRLVVLLSGLVLVPLLLVNAVQLRNLGTRLEAENREAGEVALHFAQRVLNDYLVALDPGFGLRTALNEEILGWLSEVVDREVNVYWEGRTFASSRPELYSSGLLPTRIPGEVYSELSLRGRGLTARRNQIGGVAYLELYAPLDLGQDLAPTFFVSTPLLAQEEAVSVELALLQRQAILVTSLIFLLLTAVGSLLARNFTRPLLQIVEGTDRIARGAEGLDLEPHEPELAALAEAIDDMAFRLAEGRRALLNEKRLVEEVIENITAGVVSVDPEGRVRMRNRVASELLGVEVGEPLIERLERREPLAPLIDFLSADPTRARQQTVTIDEPGGDGFEWNLVWVPAEGGGQPAALFVVEDATEILRGQRLQAWAEMARIIAHEIKNPLTPIRLSTEHLQQVYENDPEHLDQVFRRCTDNILQEVEELRRISHEFSTYSHIPQAELESCDLRKVVEKVVAAYDSVSQADGVRLEARVGEVELPVRLDARLFDRALRNLIENALRASPPDSTVCISCRREEDSVIVEVSDSGPGVDNETLSRIFDPYFSTHDSGTGLGLPIARRIVEEHGGTIGARNREEGLIVQITLPLET